MAEKSVFMRPQGLRSGPCAPLVLPCYATAKYLILTQKLLCQICSYNLSK